MANALNNQNGNQNFNQNQNLPGGQGDGNNVNRQNQNGNDDLFGGFDDFDSGDENQDNELFKAFGEDDDILDVEIGDDWLNPKKDGEDDDNDDLNLNGNDDPDGTKALMTEVKNMISQVSIDDAQIPADFDYSNRDHLKKLLNHTAQQAVASAMAIISKPIKKSLESMGTQLRAEMTKSVKIGGIQTKIEEAFEPFRSGIKDKSQLAFAGQTFKQALKTNKDPRKAAQVTQQLLKRIGINVNLQQRQGTSGNNDSGVSKTTLQGVEALDDFFGTPQRKK